MRHSNHTRQLLWKLDRFPGEQVWAPDNRSNDPSGDKEVIIPLSFHFLVKQILIFSLRNTSYVVLRPSMNIMSIAKGVRERNNTSETINWQKYSLEHTTKSDLLESFFKKSSPKCEFKKIEV